MLMVSEGIMGRKPEPFSFSIKVESCKQCPHIRHFAWGQSCALEGAEDYIPILNRNIDKISEHCPFRAKAKQ